MKNQVTKIATAFLFLAAVTAAYERNAPKTAISIDQRDTGSPPRIVITPKKSGKAKASGSELRLPRSILPRSYDVTLLPILEEGNFTTSGTVQILVDCLENTDNITLHIADIVIDDSSISITDEATNQPLGLASIVEDQDKQFLILQTSSLLNRGSRYLLTIKFTSFLKDDLRGFYRTSYVENGQIKYLGVSQMQPTDARRAFPCFDEPNMKANFTMRLGRRETQLSTSNMALAQTSPIEGMPGFVWDQYETSLPMSTYLVAMLVADFVYLESPPELSNTAFRIWTRPEAITQAEYASQIGPKVLSFYEDYFQIPFPLTKQDMAAVPDLSFGAMENWGLVTYRESTLLYDSVKSSESDKQRVASVVAHELAHQWFGDLVTMDWWSDLWLNEGFASYMEYIGADHVEPEFEIIDQIVIDDVQDVFAVDALESSHPISVTVNDPNEINELFDRISYGKGASIIRMLNKFVGDDTFRKGLALYLNSRKYGNAVQDDLWQALTQQAVNDNVNLPVDIKTIMDTWTLKMGYPVVTVERDYNTGSAQLSQARFLLNAATNSSDTTLYSWWIPLTYTSDFTSPASSTWIAYDQSLTTIQLTVEPNQWIIVNVNQVGYYRVNYDFTNWNLIRDQLLADHRQISTVNRAQIMDDGLNIARANLLPYTYPLDISTYLINELDYLPWTSSLNGFSYIDLMFVRTSGYGSLKSYLSTLITPLYNYVKFNETVGDGHLLIYTRTTALTWACKLNIGDCVSNSLQLYQAWMNDPVNPSLISPNYKRSIACTAVGAGGESEWNFAFNQYLSTNVGAEKSTLLYAMSCSNEPWILSRMLEWSLNSTSGIRRSDASSVFRNVGSNPVGRSLAFDFLRNRWSEMVAYFSSLYDLARIVDSISTGFNTPLEVAQLREFQAQHADELGTAARAVEQAIERAEANTNWMALHYQEVLDWLEQH